jgi:hypothetical protein
MQQKKCGGRGIRLSKESLTTIVRSIRKRASEPEISLARSMAAS